MGSVYRISKCRYIDDTSGTGAYMYGGRWNSKGVYMLYTAMTSSLALLETVVHLGSIPAIDFCMLTMDLPEDSIQYLDKSLLPKDWYQYPAPAKLAKIGDQFIQEGKYLALVVPSVIMPEDNAILINPKHSLFNTIKVINRRAITIDSRLVK